ncbi:nickel/cobalt transporter [Desulfovibrio ferrophilus]|uniref:Nickel/cobalt efflux system n=1 Tax=Desulfovibrio ferrophilus TaxID=241368 RepID=A0A2Z6B329_9BACT|nr:hypothetical protein [Desulfovibrio ferrophilus]BBD09919.1 high-affinity nickel-transporter [Desulfovibrio ferrophilus]
MKGLLTVLFTVWMLVAGVEAEAATNPFAAGASPRQERVATAPDGGSALSGTLGRIARWQREMRGELSARVRSLNEQPSPWGLMVFLGLSFAYGAVHAAGPGHGKSVATSYVLARGLSARRGAALGALMGAAHAASAVGVVLVLHAIARRAMMNRFEMTALWVERGSYALVMCIGLWLLVDVLKSRRAQDETDGGQGRSLLGVGLSTGLVPCPGAAIMLLFALALDALWLGLGAVMAMACGMGVTIALAAALAACCRGTLLSCAAGRSGRAEMAQKILALIGGAIVLGLGASLLGGTFA